MNWLVLSLLCMLMWGSADIFYKRSNDGSDGYSHLKTGIWVGIVMGVAAAFILPFTDFASGSFGRDLVLYAPVSLCYIASMVIGYAGMRYLEVSIISPVQNASGGFAFLFIGLYFVATGKAGSLGEGISPLEWAGTGFAVAGVMGMALVEQRLMKQYAPGDRKYRRGALALLFPLCYCLFDSIGTGLDGIVLAEEGGLGLGEWEVLVLYGLTFFLFGAGCWLFLLWKTKHPYNPFGAGELKTKAKASLFEEGGQVFYVFAMAQNPMVAAALIGTYCVVSVVLSAAILREKLTGSQYFCVALVVAGVISLALSELG